MVHKRVQLHITFWKNGFVGHLPWYPNHLHSERVINAKIVLRVDIFPLIWLKEIRGKPYKRKKGFPKFFSFAYKKLW